MNAKTLVKFVVAVAVAALLTSCPEAATSTSDNSGDDSGDDDGTTSETIELLLAGRGTDDTETSYPFYAEITLSTGTSASAAIDSVTMVMLDDAEGAYPTGVAHDGTDVIVSGFRYAEDFWPLPCFWRNDVRTDLPMPEGDYRGSADAVDPNGRFMGGFVRDMENSEYYGCYWEDGVLHLLTEIPAGAVGTCVDAIRYVDGAGLYLAGEHWDGDNAYSFCWWHITDDGTETIHSLELPAGVTEGGVSALDVDNGSVYVSGIHGSAYNTGETVCCWVDGTRTDLTDEVGAARGSAIDCASGELYVAGMVADWGGGWPENFQARLWHQGMEYELGGPDSWAQTVAATETGVIAAGWAGDPGEDTEATVWVVTGLPETAPSAAVRAAAVEIQEAPAAHMPVGYHLCEFVAMLVGPLE